MEQVHIHISNTRTIRQGNKIMKQNRIDQIIYHSLFNLFVLYQVEYLQYFLKIDHLIIYQRSDLTTPSGSFSIIRPNWPSNWVFYSLPTPLELV